jgi:hypothetical protein
MNIYTKLIKQYRMLNNTFSVYKKWLVQNKGAYFIYIMTLEDKNSKGVY